MTQTLADELEALAARATAGVLSTAERHIPEECIECPVCDGDGEVLATDYCNIDSKALGVQFYGIGSEFGAHEALWSKIMDNLPTILTALRAREPSEEMVEKSPDRRFYIDCEFDGHNGPLLSLAMVRDNGDGIHVQTNVAAMDVWVQKNVMPLMDKHDAPQSAKVYHDEIGDVIRAFMGDCDNPVIVADSPVDIARFCRALSTRPNGGWASADYPRMTFEVHNVDCYPTDMPGAVQHNAWWDAMALRRKLARAAIHAMENSDAG